jgi:hypothetical protein
MGKCELCSGHWPKAGENRQHMSCPECGHIVKTTRVNKYYLSKKGIPKLIQKANTVIAYEPGRGLYRCISFEEYRKALGYNKKEDVEGTTGCKSVYGTLSKGLSFFSEKNFGIKSIDWENVVGKKPRKRCKVYPIERLTDDKEVF